MTKKKLLKDIIRTSMIIKNLTETNEYKYSLQLYQQQVILLTLQIRWGIQYETNKSI